MLANNARIVRDTFQASIDRNAAIDTNCRRINWGKVLYTGYALEDIFRINTCDTVGYVASEAAAVLDVVRPIDTACAYCRRKTSETIWD